VKSSVNRAEFFGVMNYQGLVCRDVNRSYRLPSDNQPAAPTHVPTQQLEIVRLKRW